MIYQGWVSKLPVSLWVRPCATCNIQIFQLAEVAQRDTVKNAEDVFVQQQGPIMIITYKL